MVAAIFNQIASFSFLMAAVFSDILLIRICLVFGNLFLMIWGILGVPKWPAVISVPYFVAIDTLVWSSAALTLHSWAVTRLLMDERQLGRFKDDMEERLFQYFNRRSGINRRDFLEIYKRGRWTEVLTAGSDIPTNTEFHLIVRGIVACDIDGLRRRDRRSVEFRKDTIHVRLGSGDFMDLRLANTFMSTIGFFNDDFRAKTEIDKALLFSWTHEALKEMAHVSPPVHQAWKNVVIFVIADIAQRQHFGEESLQTDNEDFAIPKTYPSRTMRTWCWETLKWVVRSMDPRPPRGIRHKPVPVCSQYANTENRAAHASVHMA